jgi:hypothetical protein
MLFFVSSIILLQIIHFLKNIVDAITCICHFIRHFQSFFQSDLQKVSKCYLGHKVVLLSILYGNSSWLIHIFTNTYFVDFLVKIKWKTAVALILISYMTYDYEDYYFYIWWESFWYLLCDMCILLSLLFFSSVLTFGFCSCLFLIMISYIWYMICVIMLYMFIYIWKYFYNSVDCFSS